MANLYKTIESLCKAHGTTITVMCRESGASRGSLTDLKMGRISGLHPETLRKIADYFGVTIDELYGHPNKQKTATDNGDGLPDLSSASEKQRELIQRILNYSDEQVSAFLLLTQSPQDGQ